MLLVIDTCVIVSAFRSRNGASRILLDQMRTQPLRLAISSGLMMEYEAVSRGRNRWRYIANPAKRLSGS